MRIIGGIYRHRLISYPEDRPDIRPTKDRVREAIFNIIGDINGNSVLDLYAGSGSMGLEAISRGASFTSFVDISPLSKKVVLSNINSLKITSGYSFNFMPDFDYLKKCINENVTFDIIFVDPPYKFGKYEEIVKLIYEHHLLNEGGVVVLESDRHIAIDPSLFNNIKEYKYGETIVTTLRD